MAQGPRGGGRQNNNQGGGNGGGRQGQQNYTQNEQVSLQERLAFVLNQLKTRKEEMEAVLPPDLPFEKFHATINQALRNKPDILACTGVSIVNACVKSAYDGLRLDGKEAALVAHNVKVAKNPDRWEAQAEYFPMVRGLIKKILMSREVISMEAEVIYEHDTYRVLRGTNPQIHHEPRLVGARGKPVAYYSVATLKGGHVTAEIMTQADVDDVRKEAKTDFVWNRWGGEMGKKSVIRRHEKKLPSGRDMIDVEAREMFPQFDRTAPHAQLADHGRAAPPRPTRSLEHAPMEPFDIGSQQIDEREREGVVVDQQQDRQQDRQQQRDQPRQDDQENDGRETAIPADDMEWGVWDTETRAAIAKAADMEALMKVQTEAAPVLKAAKKPFRDAISQMFTDRAADIAAGPDDGAAAGGSGNATAAGDQ